MSRHWKKLVVGVLALVLLVVGGFYAYVLFIKDDAPDKLGESDLDNAVSTTVASTAAGDTTLPAGPTTTGSAAVDGVDGDWVAAQSGSTLGYRVSEVLGGVDTEGAGRTDQITGSMTIAGAQVTAAEFTVDMASITSDESRRDNQFRTRIMSVDQFPTATFVLTSPIDFGSVPAEGETITATATGDLTLRGVTRSVTFEVQAKFESGRIGVLGSIPVKFSDYEIPDPSNQFAVVKDNGLLEFVIAFDRG